MSCDLRLIANTDGIDKSIPLYLGQELKIWSAGVLVNWLVDDQAIDSIVEVFAAGITLNKDQGDEYIAKFDNRDIVKASLRQLLDRARQINANSLQIFPVPAPPAPAQAASAGTSTPASDSLLTRLPNGRWSELLNLYNQVQLNGKNRRFPERTILGAESVLARMDHEHRTSKNYSPVGLGEILQKRSFTSLDQVNGLSKNSDKNRPLIVRADGQLVQSEDNTWDPRSLLAIIDGVQAIGWAMIFVQWADEEDINTYIEWFTRICRKNAKMLGQVKEYWDHSSWTLALAMRGQTIGLNMTFKQATSEIMNDLSALNNIFMASPSPVTTTNGTRPKVPSEEDEGHPEDTSTKKKRKGDGRGKKGKDDAGKGGKKWKGADSGKDSGWNNNYVKKDDWAWKQKSWDTKPKKWDGYKQSSTSSWSTNWE